MRSPRPLLRLLLLLCLSIAAPIPAMGQSPATNADGPVPETQSDLVPASADAAGTWTDSWVTPRGEYGAVYDPVRQRMIVFGGSDKRGDENDVWILTLDGNRTWARLATAGGPPCGRHAHGAIYDPVRDRLVIFGGRSGTSYLNDVWALSLGDVPTWTQLTPTGTPPTERSGASAICDSARDRLVVFGGEAVGGSCSDVWALSLGDTPTWTDLAPAGTAPAARKSHSAVYDPVRDRLLVFGGLSGYTLLNDCYELTLGNAPTWKRLSPSGTAPTARKSHSAIYDPVRDRMIVFGGDDNSGGLNDCYSLSGLGSTPAWTKLKPSGTAPAARYGHSAIYDRTHDEMVIFGGNDAVGLSGALRNDVVRLSLVKPLTWVGSGISMPSARYGSGAIHDPVRDRMVVFGGYTGSVCLDDCYALTLADTPIWERLSPAGAAPAARTRPGAIYDPVYDRMVLYGGSGASAYNDVWALSLAATPTWTQLAPGGDLPPGGPPACCVYDAARNRMLILGGAVGTSVYALSLGGAPTWTRLEPTGSTPFAGSSLFTPVAIYDPARDRVVAVTWTFDGQSPMVPRVCTLSLGDAPAWTELVTTGAPETSMSGASAIYDPVRDRMVLFGGVFTYYSTYSIGTTSALSLGNAPAWTRWDASYDVLRCYHSAIYDPLRDRMVVFGGYRVAVGMPTTYLDDTWQLTWGEPVTASVTCPEATMWMAGSSVTLDYGITNPYGFSQIADYTLTSARDWPGFPITGSMTVGVGTTTVPISVPAPDTAAGNTNVLTFTVRTRGVPQQASGSHELRNAVVPVQLALVSAEAEPHLARLTWYTATGAGLTATVYRRSGTGEWAALGTVAADGSGRIVYEDRTVTPGASYGYRLGVWDGGVESYVGEAWVEVPVAVALALAGAEPNPAVRQLAVAFSLPDAAGARLEAYDVTGRRVAQAEVGGLGAGRHVVKLGGELRSGVYLVRLTRGEQTLTRRAVVVR